MRAEAVHNQIDLQIHSFVRGVLLNNERIVQLTVECDRNINEGEVTGKKVQQLSSTSWWVPNKWDLHIECQQPVEDLWDQVNLQPSNKWAGVYHESDTWNYIMPCDVSLMSSTALMKETLHTESILNTIISYSKGWRKQQRTYIQPLHFLNPKRQVVSQLQNIWTRH